MTLSQGNLLQKDSIEGATIEVSDIDLLSNSSLNSTSLHTEEKRLAGEKWLKNVRMAIEGVTQLLVGLVGLVGKNAFNLHSCKKHFGSKIRTNFDFDIFRAWKIYVHIFTNET